MQRVGIDLGNISVKLVIINKENSIESFYKIHSGNPIFHLKNLIEKSSVNGKKIYAGATGSSLCSIIDLNMEFIDATFAKIKGAKSLYPDIENILDIGGTNVSLIQLDKRGNIKNFVTNSLCAAGTGSFLDQQLSRLEFDYDKVKEIEISSEELPSIATRCAVFAKTDLIHRQQQGYSKQELWCGLCYGMVDTLLQTLMKGKDLIGNTLLIGGVSKNKEIVNSLKKQIKGEVIVHSLSPVLSAYGAALSANIRKGVFLNPLKIELKKPLKKEVKRPVLELKRSIYPDFKVKECYFDEYGNEIRISENLEKNKHIECYLGIDIGSTSTKLVLIDSEEKIILDIYRKTKGDPVDATKKLFSALNKIKKSKNLSLDIKGVGTTGSGRKLIGKIIGADYIVNEITAHAKGALKIAPLTRTIFEIGGQDSKYIYLSKDGNVQDCNLNYVCAAGTGSFIEEQAKKLGFDIHNVGDIVMGISPPYTSERCTVFMEQDIHNLLREGWTREETLAATLYSIARNYLTKVVGRRPVSEERIFFQGATARNKGLVAAFENILDKEIVVSPYCHVMGAYGTALLTKERGKGKSSFKGLSLAERNIKLYHNNCTYCSNKCTITYAEIEGEEENPSFGYICGREPEETKKRENNYYLPFEKRERLLLKKYFYKKKKREYKIKIPFSLYYYSYLPLFRTFLEDLGFSVIISRKTDDEIIEQGKNMAGSDFCLPIKVSYGHFQISKDEFIFFPYLIREKNNKEFTNSYFCVYVESFPSLARSSFDLKNIDSSKIISPVIDFNFSTSHIIYNIMKSFEPFFKFSKKEIKRAWKKGLLAQKIFNTQLKEQGEKILEEIEQNDERAIVIIGRPYNILDKKINLNLPLKISNLGIRVIPLDMLPIEKVQLDKSFNNIYWHYGQKILKAAKFIKENKNLFAIYLTNFSCGPDSFLVRYVEEIMQDKPFFVLELDEHGGDAGYITRVEAFLDVIQNKGVSGKPSKIVSLSKNEFSLHNREIWIPPMHPIGARLFASAFRGFGYSAYSLPTSDEEVLERGKDVTTGGECLPCALTIGGFLRKIEKNIENKKIAFFLPSATGPCRFGQYALLHRIILDRLNLKDVPLFTLSSYNNYQGLNNELRKYIWKSILISDLLFKLRCRIKPYEKNTGETEKLLEQSIREMEEIFEKRGDIERTFKEIVKRFKKIEIEDKRKPLVGIVGEIFIRMENFSNNYLVQYIEKLGGEAWLTPASEWFFYTSLKHKINAKREKNLKSILSAYLKDKFLKKEEHKFYSYAGELLKERKEPDIEEVIREGEKFLPIDVGGEGILTIGRALLFIKQGVSLIVNVAPFTCMPGNTTTALFNQIQKEKGVPVMSIFYDGEKGLNERIAPFLLSFKE